MNPQNRTLIGFSPSSLHLDTRGDQTSPPPVVNTGRTSIFSSSDSSRTLSVRNINTELLNEAIDCIHDDSVREEDKKSTSKTLTKAKKGKNKKSGGSSARAVEDRNAEAMNELRSYTNLMDKFSLHSFMIWHGKALKSTPEFQSYRRTYNNEWGGISIIIKALEEIMTNYEIKLAIINGVKVFELAILNLQFYERNDLLDCVDNIEQIRPALNSIREASKLNQQIRAAVLMQKMLRRYKAMKEYKIQKMHNDAATTIQSRARLYLYGKRAAENMRKRRGMMTEKWLMLRERLKDMWMGRGEGGGNNSSSSSSSNCFGGPKGKRLLVHIPSSSASEFSRMNFDHIHQLQNGAISCLYELADPDVVLAYVCPIAYGPSEIGYIHRYLAGLGIRSIANRLIFVVPELIQRLPFSMPVAQTLWYSAGALRKLRRLARSFSNCMIIPSSLTWVEQRISVYLDIPMVSADAIIAETLSSRSMARRVFMDAKVNTPVGAHAISSKEDLLIALSRVIVSNMDVERWWIKMNYDLNNDSFAVITVQNFSIMSVLRKEMRHLLTMNGGNPGAWFSRPVQISARRRITTCLQQELASKITILRNDKYPNWSIYLHFMQQVGCVLEAETPNTMGHVMVG